MISRDDLLLDALTKDHATPSGDIFHLRRAVESMLEVERADTITRARRAVAGLAAFIPESDSILLRCVDGVLRDLM